MAKYSDIKGFTVQTLSTDTVASQAAAGSWSSGGDLNTARRGLAGSGATTAALAFGGTVTASSALNEQYNGSSWTEVGDLNTARTIMGGTGQGTNTSALIFGGYQPTAASLKALTEEWNGSSWTEVADLNTAVMKQGSAGTASNALSFGGSLPADTANMEEWSSTSNTDKTISTD